MTGFLNLEVTPRFKPRILDLQSVALPLGHATQIKIIDNKLPDKSCTEPGNKIFPIGMENTFHNLSKLCPYRLNKLR